jgi:polyisoprenoid-binding protein YceI
MTWRAALACVVLTTGAAQAEEARYRLDPDHTVVAFEASHIGYASVIGLFQRVTGSFRFDEATRTLAGLEVKVELASVFTNHAKRDEHLRSAEFLDAVGQPVATFVMTGAEALGGDHGRITGELTLRNTSRPITLDVRLNRLGPYPFGGNYVLGASATTVVKRSDFGSTYAVENGWVADQIPLRIEIEAIREADG